MKKLYYLGEPSDGFGWGVANTNLIAALKKHCEVIVDTSTRDEFDAPVFVPVVDSSLRSLRDVFAPKILGYCFTEWPIEDRAHVAARKYDVLFAGSTWNCHRLIDAGVKRVKPLIQGVDSGLFFPQPYRDSKVLPLPLGEGRGEGNSASPFVVFSGGKYEFRKGQDLVLGAMSHFMRRHPDVVLLAAWHNPWPMAMASMNNSWIIDPKDPWRDMPEDRCILLPPTTNQLLPKIYAQADIGLFPNRCEAGTNMVMTEFMACGRPVIATAAHGHLDVLPAEAYLLRTGSFDPAGWFNPPISDIIWQLENAYRDRARLPELGLVHAAAASRFTWDACARVIAAEL